MSVYLGTHKTISGNTQMILLREVYFIDMIQMSIIRKQWSLFIGVKKITYYYRKWKKQMFDHSPVQNHPIAQVQSYKYLDVHIDHSIIYYLCSLRFYVHCAWRSLAKNFIFVYWSGCLKSVIRFGMTAWFEDFSVSSESKLSHLV